VVRKSRLDPYILAKNGVLYNSLLIAVFYTPFMTGLEQAFYILGIIVFSVFLLLVIIGTIMALAIRHQIRKAKERARFISDEIREAYENGKRILNFLRR